MQKKIIQDFLKEKELDAILFTSKENQVWSSKLDTSAGMLVYTKTKSYFLSDFRYKTYLEQNNHLIDEIIIIEKSNDVYFETLNKIFEKENVKKVGFESEFIIYNVFLELQDKLSSYNLIPTKTNILRIIKSNLEIQAIANGAKILDQAISHIKSFIQVGMTEKEVQLELDYFILKQGAQKLSFDSIVAFGKNSAIPHAKPSNNQLKKEDIVLIDCGCVIDGYCSDQTRTFFINKANDVLLKAYNDVLVANLLGISLSKKGNSTKMIHQKVQEFLLTKPHGETFKHGLGHGLGIQIHELPNLKPTDEKILDNNMVITIEPGIYIEGLGGIRIEDDVVIKNNEPIILTSGCSKKLEILKK